jgi:hypothetical protein
MLFKDAAKDFDNALEKASQNSTLADDPRFSNLEFMEALLRQAVAPGYHQNNN